MRQIFFQGASFLHHGAQGLDIKRLRVGGGLQSLRLNRQGGEVEGVIAQDAEPLGQPAQHGVH